MPGYNGTGPAGRGPGTGRGLGVCTGARPRGFGLWGGARGGLGLGRGAGRGAGFGPCRWWAGGSYPVYSPSWQGPEDEKAFLKDQAAQLKAELADLEQRMNDLEQA
jgi:hypothetical protein